MWKFWLWIRVEANILKNFYVKVNHSTMMIIIIIIIVGIVGLNTRIRSGFTDKAKVLSDKYANY